MPDANTVFQHSWYISNQFNALMYGKLPARALQRCPD